MKKKRFLKKPLSLFVRFIVTFIVEFNMTLLKCHNGNKFGHSRQVFTNSIRIYHLRKFHNHIHSPSLISIKFKLVMGSRHCFARFEKFSPSPEYSWVVGLLLKFSCKTTADVVVNFQSPTQRGISSTIQNCFHFIYSVCSFL